MKSNIQMAILVVMGLLVAGIVATIPRDGAPCEQSDGGVVGIFAPSLLCHEHASTEPPLPEPIPGHT